MSDHSGGSTSSATIKVRATVKIVEMSSRPPAPRSISRAICSGPERSRSASSPLLLDEGIKTPSLLKQIVVDFFPVVEILRGHVLREIHRRIMSRLRRQIRGG